MGKTKHEKKAQYVQLPYWIMDTFAWRRLTPTEMAAWLYYTRVYNGRNNGRIALSSRELGNNLNVSRWTAERATRTLITLGFLVCTRAASFGVKRHAAEYLMTHLPGQKR